MYTLIRTLSGRNLLTRQLPVLTISVVLAELFYKFHSFSLEAGAFLLTWFALDFILQAVLPARDPAATCE